mmetsp:Transcript_75435/g.197754  ORF Transcript_75435/g.197754 Transcript_75435/m.197754 type:complete len:304 (+) Transcript_75435:383-1294(+)
MERIREGGPPGLVLGDLTVVHVEVAGLAQEGHDPPPSHHVLLRESRRPPRAPAALVAELLDGVEVAGGAHLGRGVTVPSGPHVEAQGGGLAASLPRGYARLGHFRGRHVGASDAPQEDRSLVDVVVVAVVVLVCVAGLREWLGGRGLRSPAGQGHGRRPLPGLQELQLLLPPLAPGWVNARGPGAAASRGTQEALLAILSPPALADQRALSERRAATISVRVLRPGPARGEASAALRRLALGGPTAAARHDGDDVHADLKVLGARRRQRVGCHGLLSCRRRVLDVGRVDRVREVRRRRDELGA